MANIEAKRISIAPNMDRAGSDRSICLRMKINRKEASATSAALEITNAKPVHVPLGVPGRRSMTIPKPAIAIAVRIHDR